MEPISFNWLDFKAFVVSRSLSIQWRIVSNVYMLLAIDGPLAAETQIPINDPNYDFAQSDFERNFRSKGNKPFTSPAPIDPLPLEIRLDDTSTVNVTYVGKAAVGTTENDAFWQIQKINQTTGIKITWAGNGGFNQVWNNRTSLSYR